MWSSGRQGTGVSTLNNCIKTFNLLVQDSVWVVFPFERGDCASKAKANRYSYLEFTVNLLLFNICIHKYIVCLIGS